MIPKRTVRYLLTCFIVNIFIFVPIVYVQAQPNQIFQVIHLPRKASYSKEKLNAELSPLKDKEAVKKLLRSKNFPAGTSIVLFINRANNQSSYWTINTSSPSDKEDNRIILQSRDNTTTKFFKVSEFKSFFKDTIAIIDTLAIELFIKDEDYPDNGYIISSTCNKADQQKKIELKKGKLLFTNELVKCKEQIVAVTIYNENNPGRMLATCKISFVTAEQKEMLLSMSEFIKIKDPDMSAKDVALLLNGYASNHFGKIYFSQLLNWLEKNNAAFGHGDNR